MAIQDAKSVFIGALAGIGLAVLTIALLSHTLGIQPSPTAKTSPSDDAQPGISPCGCSSPSSVDFGS